jgi:Xaa-Pro aminopeptidase
VIAENNNTVIKEGMTFHVRIALSGVHKELARSVVAIGDTVVIVSTGEAQVVTFKVQKKYTEISYSLEDSD